MSGFVPELRRAKRETFCVKTSKVNTKQIFNRFMFQRWGIYGPYTAYIRLIYGSDTGELRVKQGGAVGDGGG
jgi:hypothetical protein